MRILLIQPNYDSHIIHPPLGLGYLASCLRKQNHIVSIFDGTLNNALSEDCLHAVSDFNADLVGISVLTRGYSEVKEIIQSIRAEYKKLPIVVGGTQVTADPEKILASLMADFAVIGEGENTLVELADILKNGSKNQQDFKKIDGLAYFDLKGKIRINKPRELIKNLNIIPFPAWDLMLPKKYRIVPILEPAKAFPVAPVVTSRGCPYACSFCASNVTWKRKIRFRNPENVLDEIKLLKNSYGVKEIHISDDNFTMDIERAEKICDLMIKEKINLSWQCPNGVRVDRLPLSLLQKMKAAGCYSVGLGIESGCQEILKNNRKNLDLKIVPGVLRKLKEVGIESYGFFILGLPGDTKETIKQTISFALDNSFDRVWFNLFTPYPGSPAFDKWLRNSDFDFDKIDWSKHDCSTAVSRVEGISFSQLEKIQRIALFRFYFRPQKILSILKKIRLKELVTLLMTRFFRNFFTRNYPVCY